MVRTILRTLIAVNRYRVASCIDGSDKAHNVVEANAHTADAVQLLGRNMDNNRIWFQASQMHVSSLLFRFAVNMGIPFIVEMLLGTANGWPPTKERESKRP